MTFTHPDESDKTLFCPWHGKVQTPQLRVHFSWPVRVDKSLLARRLPNDSYFYPKLRERVKFLEETLITANG